MTSDSTLLAAAPRRFTRSQLERGPSLAEKVSGEVRRLSYGTILHRLRLRERYPATLLATPRDPVAGDRAAGEALLGGRMDFAGHSERLAGFDWRAAGPMAFRDYADSFDWVRDLAATGSPRARAILQPLLVSWLAANADYNGFSWAPERIGARLLLWVLHSGLIAGQAELTVRSAWLTAMGRGARHLQNCIERAPEGLPRLRAAAGLAAAGLALPESEARLARGEAALRAALAEFVSGDGGVASRAPADQLALLELLLGLEAVYAARGRALPVAQVLARVAGALGGLAHGDATIAAFHGVGLGGARVGQALRLCAAAAEPDSGYQRLQAGGSVVVMDAGPPPEQRASQGCHASTLAFEFSHAGERLIINCGGARGAGRPPAAELAAALRTTAAHSALVVADSNSTRLRDDGCLGRGVAEVTVRREEAGGGVLVEATHDGYRRRFGLDHRRRLFLSADGRDLRGEDELSASHRLHVRAPFAIRFHLHPTLSAEARAGEVLFACPSGAVWSFRCRDAVPTIEDSLVLGTEGARRTQQIVITGHGPAVFAWTLKRID